MTAAETGLVIDDVDAADVDWPAQGPTYEGADWLAASRWPGDQQRYLHSAGGLLPIRTVDRPRAWARMNLVDICAGTAFAVPQDPEAVAAARRAAVPHLLVAAPGYFTVPIGRSADPATLVDAALEIAGQGSRTVGFAYLPPASAPLTAELRRRNFAVGTVSATTVLELPGTSFQHYLQMLPRRRGSQVRREMTEFERRGGRVRHVHGNDVPAALPLVAELERALQVAHGFDAGADLYHRLNSGFHERFGTRMHVLEAYLHDWPVATVTVVGDGVDLVVRAYGARDGAAVRHAFVYFNLVYYETIRLAYRLGITRIWFGTSTLRAKLWRGLRPVPLLAAVESERGGPLLPLLERTDVRLRALLEPGARGG